MAAKKTNKIPLWKSPRDAFLLVDPYMPLTALGVAALAAVEYQFLKENFPGVQSYIDDNKSWIVPWGLALSAAPTIASKFFERLKTRREQAVMKRDETRRFSKFLADYVQKRVKYLIPKAREVHRGVVSDEYSKNVLTDCESYFKARKEGITVRAYYYAMVGSGRVGSRRLEYKLGNRDSPDAGRSKFSENARSLDEAKLTVQRICEGIMVYCRDVDDPKCVEELKLDPKRTRVYKSFLSVPIYRDGNHEVIGMFSVNCDEPGILREVDQHVVKTFAWFLSASLAMDETRAT